MRNMYRGFIGLTTALCLTLVACGDTLTGVDSGDPLTSAEIAAVVAAFGSSLEQTGVSAAPAAGPAQAPVSVNTSADVSVPCDQGTFDMSASISGTIDDETFDTDVTMDASWNPIGCQVTDGTSVFTLDGDPRVELHLELTSADGTVTINGTEQGGFSFTADDGRAGSCAFDVTFSIVTTATSVDATVSGSICGINADGFATFGTGTQG
jgi:hypothetical protein